MGVPAPHAIFPPSPVIVFRQPVEITAPSNPRSDTTILLPPPSMKYGTDRLRNVCTAYERDAVSAGSRKRGAGPPTLNVVWPAIGSEKRTVPRKFPYILKFSAISRMLVIAILYSKKG